MVAAGNIEQEVSKPRTVSLKARVRRMKEDMGKIREDQIRIRAEQKNIGDRFGEVKQQCDELKLETQMIVKQSAINRIRLTVMLDMLQARRDCEFDRAAALARLLAAFNKTKL